MRLLIDTDVLLDVALDRPPFSKPAGKLLDLLQSGQADGFIAWHSVSNIYYLCSSSKSDSSVREMLRDLCTFIQVAPVETLDLLRALSLNMQDFEDAMQAAAALACRAEIIVTRNLRDYTNSPVQAMTPVQILDHIGCDNGV